MNLIPALSAIVIFILGTAVGSFISVVSYRLHERKSGIVKGRSHCRNCEGELPVKDLVPLLSYLNLRGRCRFCSKDISFLYPTLEIVSGFLFVGLFYRYPFLDDVLNFNVDYFFLFLLWGFYTFVLVFTFFYDVQYKKVADQILLPAILIGLIATISSYAPHIISALIGLTIAVAFFGGQYVLSKGKWIGGGDIRIGAFIGVILGWKLTALAILLSYVLGSIVGAFIAIQKKKFHNVAIPFAPFLVSGTLLAFYFGEDMIAWYLRISGMA